MGRTGFLAAIAPHGTKYLTDSQATNIIEAVRFAKSLGLPIGELPILLGARSIAALEDDEFDDLLLEVVVLGEAQGTPKKGGSAAEKNATFRTILYTATGNVSFE